MKRILLLITAVTLLTSCGVYRPESGGFPASEGGGTVTTESLELTDVVTVTLFPETGVTVAPDVQPIEADDSNPVAQTAVSLIGLPFISGGDSPATGFDNSGFIYYVLRQNGFLGCPRGVKDQSVYGTLINSISLLKPGDLVFFSEESEFAEFGGIYIGGGTMVTCPFEGQNVKTTDITTQYYISNFFCGNRIY
ncbi:MAG: C40 family peptidase [Oscillospiraceae bacterium]|jgi:cell wall-associated NlpC family hydrolase|nr:C40 family peptidase [Oscillospiraceae bacterium]